MGVGHQSGAFQPAVKIDGIIAGGWKSFTDRTLSDGRKLKSELKLIRARGYAVDEGEHQPGIRCVGAPIHDRAGRVVAGLSVSGPARRLKKDQIVELAKVVVHHARLVAAKL